MLRINVPGFEMEKYDLFVITKKIIIDHYAYEGSGKKVTIKPKGIFCIEKDTYEVIVNIDMGLYKVHYGTYQSTYKEHTQYYCRIFDVITDIDKFLKHGNIEESNKNDLTEMLDDMINFGKKDVIMNLKENFTAESLREFQSSNLDKEYELLMEVFNDTIDEINDEIIKATKAESNITEIILEIDTNRFINQNNVNCVNHYKEKLIDHFRSRHFDTDITEVNERSLTGKRVLRIHISWNMPCKEY